MRKRGVVPAAGELGRHRDYGVNGGLRHQLAGWFAAGSEWLSIPFCQQLSTRGQRFRISVAH